ncbi:hypothetical protein BGZ65_009459, partial [Modicella reniformis]
MSTATIHGYFIGQAAETWELEDFIEFYIKKGGSNDGKNVWMRDLKLIRNLRISEEITEITTGLIKVVPQPP